MSKIARFRRKTNGFTKGNHFNLGIFDFKGTNPADSAVVPLVDTVSNVGRGMTLTQVMSTFCSSMTLPAVSTPATLVNVHEGSPKVSIGGTKVYSPWTVDFYGDEVMLLRSMFIKWNQLVTNDTNHSYGLPSLYKSNSAFACLLSPTDIPVHCYTFKGLWPSEINALTVDSGDGSLMKFSVTFNYDYFTLNNIEGFGLAKAHEANEAFQSNGGLFGGGISAGARELGEQFLNAPMSTRVKVPF